jgi:hypothetical protein
MSGETEKAVSGWTTDTLHQHMQREIDDLRALLDERAANQKQAISDALTAADKLIQAALVSAEKAVDKALDANEKRFEGVNEFRGQLTDQAATFVRRDEIDIRITALGDKLDAETKRNADLIAALTTRLDTSQGTEVGKRSQTEAGRDSTRFYIGIAAALLLGLQIYNALKP